jgi:hypothetical protein
MDSFVNFCLLAFALLGLASSLSQILVILWPDNKIGKRIRPPTPSSAQWDLHIECLKQILDEVKRQRILPPPVMEVVETVQPRYRTRANRAADGPRGPTQ